MTVANLEEFLQLPKTKLPREYIDGEIVEKPILKGKPSRWQLKLCDRLNQNA